MNSKDMKYLSILSVVLLLCNVMWVYLYFNHKDTTSTYIESTEHYITDYSDLKTNLQYSLRREYDTDEIEHINLTTTSECDNLSETVCCLSDVKIISLETTETSFIRDVSSLILSDDRIIVFDQYNLQCQIKVFDRNGKWIASSTRGQGPGEITKAYDVAYDKKLERIIVQQNGWISIFDKNLKYIKDKECFGYDHLVINGDDYIFKTLNSQKNEELGDEYSNHQIIVTDIELNIKHVARKLKDVPNKTGLHNIMISKDGVSFVDIDNDTIYSIANGKVLPKYILTYPNKLAPPQASLTAWELNEYYSTNNGFAFYSDYIETDSHQFINVYNQKERKGIWAYREKRTGKMRQTLIARDNINSNTLAYPIATLNNKFVSVSDYENIQRDIDNLRPFISDSDYNLLKNMDEEANPVLVLYSFKPFE